MINNLPKKILILIILILGHTFSGSVFSEDCLVLRNLEKSSYINTSWSDINQACLEQLSPSSYNKLISILIEEKIHNSIIENSIHNNRIIFDQLILKTIELYTNSNNSEYSRSLLNLLETQKLTILQDYFDDDCTPLKNQAIRPLKNQAILYTHSLPKNQFLTLLITNNNIKIHINHTSIIKREVIGLRNSIINPIFTEMLEIDKHIEQFKVKDESNPSYINIRKHAKKLYKLLIQPFSKELSNLNIEHLIFIPDSVTGIFPVEALLDDKNNEYVLDKNYSISYAPNLSKTNKNTNKNKNLLFISPDQPGKNSGSNEDLKLLNNLLFVSSRIQGKKATPRGLFNTITNKSISILYLSSHAQFKSDFDKSFIQLFENNKLYVKNFERMTSSLTARVLPPDLVVLSACETAKSEGGTVDASLGLAGIAARSGVNTVVASLWVTRSPEVLLGRSGEQGESFFHLISNSGLSKAKALQKSKQLLKKNHSIYEWAAFILIGDWGKI